MSRRPRLFMQYAPRDIEREALLLGSSGQFDMRRPAGGRPSRANTDRAVTALKIPPPDKYLCQGGLVHPIPILSMKDALLIAEVVVAKLGPGAVMLLERRALDCDAAGDAEGARLWRRLAQAARLLTPTVH